MQQLPLIGGSYSSRSVIANAQRCQNLFPEPNRADSPTRMTHYQRPGLVPLATPGTAGAGRLLYQASNGDGYMIVGRKVYFIARDWTLYPLGDITDQVTTPSTPCSMVDNGIEALIVNGAPYAGNAAGSILFLNNPTNLDTITLNGVVWTFVAGAPVGNQTQIGGTTAFTIASLVIDLLASANVSIGKAYYTWVTGPGAGQATLQIVYKTPGADGTLFTLAASSDTPSGASLVYGTVFPGYGWTLTLGSLSTSAVTFISDPAWTGADRVDFIDTFIVWNMPGTRNFGSTLSNDILPLDALYLAGKTAWPDPLRSLCVCAGQLTLVGSLKSELWYNAGSTAFPFARLPGTSIEHGTSAKYSVATGDLDIFWLSGDIEGQGIVLRQRGNDIKRISNFALEYQIAQMSDISDAVGYCFLKEGHLFYVLSFPTGNQTWVWDASVNDPELGWSQRGWTDTDGVFNRDRGVLGAVLYGKNVVLDWENGTLYEQDSDTYTDTVLGVEYPITYLRTFPHLMSGTDLKTGQPILANGQMVQHERFAIDVECGGATSENPEFTVRYSDDRGASWTGTVLVPGGKLGVYTTRPDIRSLGQAMDRVYEVSWSFPGKVALNGAWVEGKVLNQ